MMDSGKEIIVREGTVEFLNIASSIIEEEMGQLHSYYAVESVRRRLSKVLIAFIDGAPAGVGVYYVINGKLIQVCVHYYIVVRKEYRKMGLGKILVASIEELNREVHGFIATTTYENHISRKLFGSLGYSEYTWDYIEEALGYKAFKEILRATCGFEDDLIMVKSEAMRPLELLSLLSNERKVIRILWENICWQPWLKLNRMF